MMSNPSVPAAAEGLPGYRSNTGPRQDIDPAKLPNLYALIVDGVCMEPHLMNGKPAVFDKGMPVHNGDLVGIWFRPEIVPPGRPGVMVKRLVIGAGPNVTFPFVDHPDSEITPVIIVEQDKPYRQIRYRCRDILAIHRCIGQAWEGMERRQLTDEERDALRVDRVTSDDRRAA